MDKYIIQSKFRSKPHLQHPIHYYKSILGPLDNVRFFDNRPSTRCCTRPSVERARDVQVNRDVQVLVSALCIVIQ